MMAVRRVGSVPVWGKTITVGNGRWNVCNTLDIRVLNRYLKNVSKKWALAGKMAKFAICNKLIFIYLYTSTLTQLLPLSYVSPMSMDSLALF